jgi:hypothetical protein
MVDDTPHGQRKQDPTNTKGRVGNKGMGLYQDHVTGTTAGDAGDAPYDDDKRPLNDITHDTKNKEFGAQWEINDNSPANTKTGPPKKQESHLATKTNWSLYQQSPDARDGINIAGNGMGGRKGTEAAWSLFEESPARKENASKQSATSRAIKTEGDGMGGKKGAESFWDF